MPVKVRCTSCDKVLTVPDTARGKAVKCPNCQERIAVPDEDSSSVGMKVPGKGGGDKVKKKPAKPTKPADSEDALASFDLSRAEDTNARICFKCGFDMKYQDEEDSECPQCGHDSESGGQGKRAQKKAMRGPDPDDFYPGLAKSSWKFVVKNIGLAWRTDAYIAVCLLISMLCGFLYLWLSAVPPRAFFVLCLTVSFMVIPGWIWLLGIEVIQLTLERKDKFKRINFDFFLASAMGAMFLGWLVAIALPLMIVPLGVGYYLVNYSGSPPWMMGVCAGIGAIPALWMLPISMSHMSMPISTPGWLIWRVVPLWFKSIKPLSVWLMWLFLTTLPLTAGAAVIGGVWGNSISNIVTTMEANATTRRARLAAENAPKGKNAPPQADPNSLGQIVDVDLKPLIGPAIILLVMCLPVGFIALFNMRINGQFTYFHKTRLEMIDKRKEYKYVAKGNSEEDDEDELKPRTTALDMKEAVLAGAVCALLGAVGGMLFGALSGEGIKEGIAFGALCGAGLCHVIGGFMILGAAFTESAMWGLIYLFVPFGQLVYIFQFWNEARRGFLISVIGGFVGIAVFLLCIAVSIAMGAGNTQTAPQAIPAVGLHAPAATSPATMKQRNPIQTVIA